jgi:hypothetical protein
MLMIRVFLSAVLLAINPATISRAESSECARISGLASARARWAATRLSHIDAAHAEKICHDYAITFYESVTVRQTASICESSTDRRRLDLVLLDTEIDAFDNLIAEHCGSQWVLFPNRAPRSNHLHDIESAGRSRITKDLMGTVQLALI